MKIMMIVFLILGLNACGYRETPAPVVESHWQTTSLNAKTHRVSRGETLYAVAFKYDMDYQRLARLNHLSKPYAIKVGQVLSLKGSQVYHTVATRPAVSVSPRAVTRAPLRQAVRPRGPQVVASAWNSRQWLKPAVGRVVATFAPAQGRKGIDIAGKNGEKVVSSRAGVVAYAGTGIAGYGNLIIIKHDNQYLTAYGNNRRNLVKEGQKIKAGQIIAEMGIIDRRYYGVHFEIRQSGRPVNPLSYI